MADDNQSIGGYIFLLLIIAVSFLCIYLYARIQKQNLAKREARIRENVRRAENASMTGLDGDFSILEQSQLMDTRSRDRVENFVQIDPQGTVFVNNKGIHYVGANRRLSWDWNKLMEIRAHQELDNTIPFFPQVSILFRLVVSSRQKISGFKFQGTQVSQKIVGDFLQKRLLIAKEKSPPKPLKANSKPSTTNVTYNIQNVHDSVIHANVENKEH